MAPRRNDNLQSSLPRSNHNDGDSRSIAARERMRKLERAYSSPSARSSSPHHTKPPRRVRGVPSADRFEKSDSSLDYGDLTTSMHQDRNKLRVTRPSVKRQKSNKSAGMKRTKSKSPSPLIRQNSKPSLSRQNSTPKLPRQTSKPKLPRQTSKPKLLRQKSKQPLARQQSATRGRPSLSRNASSKRMELARSQSNSNARSRSNSQPRPSLNRRHSATDVAVQVPSRRGDNNWRHKFKKIEEKPRRGLVVIWLVVLAELGFDLGTTIIAFRAMLEDHDCCGYELNLGPLPLTVATPFILLICLELSILVRAVALTLWPSLMDKKFSDTEDESEDGPKRSKLAKLLCCCLRWNVKILLKIVNALVIVNPFFACIIAWMLLYQSDKTESFIVLGLEAGSIILHFIAVKLEGSVATFKQFLLHCLPLVAFFASVALVLIYLKQEGVCYIVEEAVFQFQGCETCPDGFPPVDGNCDLGNGTVVAVADSSLFDINNFDDLDELTAKTSSQGTFCGDENDGYPTNFCFFDYQ